MSITHDTSLFSGYKKTLDDYEPAAIKRALKFTDVMVPAGKPIDQGVFDNHRWSDALAKPQPVVAVDLDRRDEIENGLNLHLRQLADKAEIDEDFAAAGDLAYWQRHKNTIPAGFGRGSGVKSTPVTISFERHLYNVTVKLLAQMLEFHDALSMVLRHNGDTAPEIVDAP
jgi:hypothetical protein